MLSQSLTIHTKVISGCSLLFAINLANRRLHGLSAASLEAVRNATPRAAVGDATAVVTYRRSLTPPQVIDKKSLQQTV
ncbi:hypothetical protein SAMN05421752_10348 [Natronorubrum thiooxidans]|uniref:Uncharacterized protein n=1 Tax=Natronorubrum thiooxidans TaxID=308853 RepID=A0A1N7DZD0_9EURY|nr:hypothetical protein SAMN05421752_10348 [Natronorubrum thiooxidans]